MEIYTMRATIPTRVLQRKTYNGPPSFEPRLKLPDCLVSVLMSQPLDFIVIRRSMLRAIRCICNFTTVVFYDLDNSCVYYNARDVSHKNLNYLLKYNFFLCMKNINYYLLWKEKKRKEDDPSFHSENFNLKRYKECLIHRNRDKWIARRWELHWIKNHVI